jgi:hypothetical protein
MMKPVIIFVLLTLVLAGCRGTFDRPGEEAAKDEEPRDEGIFDPMGLPEDYKIVPADHNLPAGHDSSTSYDNSPVDWQKDSAAADVVLNESYRIQLFTSNTYGPAARELKIATEVFDIDVRLDYEVPYYKVRVGNFTDRDEAEQYLPAAKEAGYNNAWVVKVITSIRSLEDIYDEGIPPLLDSSAIDEISPEPADDVPENTEN